MFQRRTITALLVCCAALMIMSVWNFLGADSASLLALTPAGVGAVVSLCAIGMNKRLFLGWLAVVLLFLILPALFYSLVPPYSDDVSWGQMRAIVLYSVTATALFLLLYPLMRQTRNRLFGRD